MIALRATVPQLMMMCAVLIKKNKKIRPMEKKSTVFIFI
jgi:hypothetical protein